MLVKNHILLFMLKDKPCPSTFPSHFLSAHLKNDQRIFTHNGNMITARISSGILLDGGDVSLECATEHSWQLGEGL